MIENGERAGDAGANAAGPGNVLHQLEAVQEGRAHPRPVQGGHACAQSGGRSEQLVHGAELSADAK